MEKFSTSLYGYNKKEVNKFVDDVVREMEELISMLKEKDEQINLLESKLVKDTNICIMARREANKILHDTYDKAANIMNDVININN